MNILKTMPNLRAGLFMILLTGMLSIVSGCGVVPGGQASTRTFTVTGFTLPVAMVHTGDVAIRARLSNIASSRRAVQALVNRTVMQTVFDVLESHGRSALLPDAVISSILGQLTINITYEPLECKKAALNPAQDPQDPTDDQCIIVSNTVTGICTKAMQAGGARQRPGQGMRCNMPTVIKAIPPRHLTIGGTISTTNIIMASWSRTMWQSVVNRGRADIGIGSA